MDKNTKIKIFSIISLIISILLYIYIFINYKLDDQFTKTIVKQWSVWAFVFSTTVTIISFKFYNAYKKYIK